jgi:hypothetical protein
MIMEYVPDEVSIMILNVMVRLVPLYGNTHYVALVDVIQTPVCSDDCSSVSVRQEL